MTQLIMTTYIWQAKEWPSFTWQPDVLIDLLAQTRKTQGMVLSQSTSIGLDIVANTTVSEALTTSAIEGEILDEESIRSSVAKKLGLPIKGLPSENRKIDGLIAMLLDAINSSSAPLTAKRLHGWQAGLFPTGYSGIHKIAVGRWRTGDEPMRIVSRVGHQEKIHYEAPPSSDVPKEMDHFLKWWNSSHRGLDGIIRAGIAHFWFVAIHPYDDGNGRIARALTDMALAQDEKTKTRLYSISSQIKLECNEYYNVLEKTSRQNQCGITVWLEWFLKMTNRAFSRAKVTIDASLQIAQFWKTHSQTSLNDRQRKVVRRLLENHPSEFVGGITNKKYVSLTRTSRETAKRDLSDLEKKGVLKRNTKKGRSVSYSIRWPV